MYLERTEESTYSTFLFCGSLYEMLACIRVGNHRSYRPLNARACVICLTFPINEREVESKQRKEQLTLADSASLPELDLLPLLFGSIRNPYRNGNTRQVILKRLPLNILQAGEVQSPADLEIWNNERIEDFEE
ncbi:Acetyl-coenzyme A carboxylase carboxyl transferase subunit beta [Trichinella spiralis]|uniref:Acetyl-coenzyme A carboxylase carboxyl transferase subunit beta n=1 Tax=Trichinella spiralis TaxID=6334 RepID=A0ABR3KJS9_TRISP